MKSQIVLFLFVLTFPFSSILGQDAFKRNAAFIELGGNGLMASLNVERQFSARPGWGARVGAGIYFFSPSKITIPVAVNYLWALKENRSFVEAGFGVTYAKADVRLYMIVDYKEPVPDFNHSFSYMPYVAWRWQGKQNLLGKVTLAPLVVTRHGAIPFLGLSLGKVF